MIRRDLSLSVKQNGVKVVQYQRESTGEIIGMTDALGRTTRIDRDLGEHVLAVHQPNGSTTAYEYDQGGHRTAQIDGDGHRITFQYDPAGHLIKQTNALGQVLTWRYDSKGHLVQRTNGIQTITYRYNDVGLLDLLDYGKVGERIRYAYDAKGRFKKVSTPTNSITLYYDKKGRVIARQLTRSTTGDRVVRYTYDDAGRRASVVLSEKEQSVGYIRGYRLLQQTEYVYDGAGHLASIRSNGSTSAPTPMTLRAALRETYRDGIVGRYTYDAFGRQTARPEPRWRDGLIHVSGL